MRGLFRLAGSSKPLTGKRVLCWDPSPYPVLSAMINSIGAALVLRGAEVETVLCDGPRDICQGATLETGITEAEIGRWAERCPGCYARTRMEAGSFLLKTCALGGLVTVEAVRQSRKLADEIPLDELFAYEYRGVEAGRHAKAEVIRHYVDKVAEKDWTEDIIRECFFTALVVTDAALAKIDAFRPDAVYMIHAQYAPWGPAYDAAAAMNIPVIRIQSGYFPSLARFRVFADGQPVGPKTPSESRWAEIKKIALTQDQDKILDEYFWRRYNKAPSDEHVAERSGLREEMNGDNGLGNILFPSAKSRAGSREDLLRRLGLNGDRPIWCIFPNVAWDAALQEVPKAYADDTDWLIETVETITQAPEVQWIVKVHPRRYKDWPDVYDIPTTLQEHFGAIPEELTVIPSDADINTFDIFNLIDGGVFYVGHTASTELTMMGKPAIMAGEAMSAKRGFTHDADTPEKYKDLLRKAAYLSLLSQEETSLARRLAYNFFIETQVPLRMMNIANGVFHSFNWDRLESLLPGRDPFIDAICGQFFDRDDIILPEELIPEAIKVWR